MNRLNILADSSRCVIQLCLPIFSHVWFLFALKVDRHQPMSQYLTKYDTRLEWGNKMRLNESVNSSVTSTYTVYQSSDRETELKRFLQYGTRSFNASKIEHWKKFGIDWLIGKVCLWYPGQVDWLLLREKCAFKITSILRNLKILISHHK